MLEKKILPERLSREVIYENPWVNLYIDRVMFPDGRIINEHHVLEFDKQAVGVIVGNPDGEILFVHAYRYTTDSIEWEIPAGGMDEGETVLECAAREVLEETGYETRDHRKVYSYYPMNGIANKIFHIVECEAGGKTADFDHNEINKLRWVSRQELKEMISRNEINDGFTLSAVLLKCFKD